jgi:hypothetical protein
MAQPVAREQIFFAAGDSVLEPLSCVTTTQAARRETQFKFQLIGRAHRVVFAADKQK